jgi:arsenate reductase-like glutaredoxin family protein
MESLLMNAEALERTGWAGQPSAKTRRRALKSVRKNRVEYAFRAYGENGLEYRALERA